MANPTRRSAMLLAMAGLGGAGLVSGARADYPDRPIRLIHGFAPGGPADVQSRIVAELLAPQLRQQLVVEARPGAGGNIGADAVAKADPDGYTLGLVTGGHAVSAALSERLPFDPVESFQMISTVADYAFVIAARPGFEGGDLRRAIEAARARPGAISFGSAGAGTTQHLTGELLASSAGIKLLHVPYRGDAAAILGLMGDQVQLVVGASSAVLPQIEAGSVVPLAVSTAERWGRLPDVPTVAQCGVPGFDVRTWAGLLAPRGTPGPIVERVRAALAAALSTPDARGKLEGIVAGTVRLRGPDEMKAMIALEMARWRKVMGAAGIR